MDDHDHANPDGTDAQTDRPPDRRITSPERATDISITPGVLFGVLADARERRILYYLTNNGGALPLEEIGKSIAAWENDTTVELTTEEMRNRVIAGMYHADVPKLEEYGFIEYERESGHMSITNQTEEIIPMLELAESLEDEDFEAYLGQATPDVSEDNDGVHE